MAFKASKKEQAQKQQPERLSEKPSSTTDSTPIDEEPTTLPSQNPPPTSIDQETTTAITTSEKWRKNRIKKLQRRLTRIEELEKNGATLDKYQEAMVKSKKEILAELNLLFEAQLKKLDTETPSRIDQEPTTLPVQNPPPSPIVQEAPTAITTSEKREQNWIKELKMRLKKIEELEKKLGKAKKDLLTELSHQIEEQLKKKLGKKPPPSIDQEPTTLLGTTTLSTPIDREPTTALLCQNTQPSIDQEPTVQTQPHPESIQANNSSSSKPSSTATTSTKSPSHPNSSSSSTTIGKKLPIKKETECLQSLLDIAEHAEHRADGGHTPLGPSTIHLLRDAPEGVLRTMSFIMSMCREDQQQKQQQQQPNDVDNEETEETTMGIYKNPIVPATGRPLQDDPQRHVPAEAEEDAEEEADAEEAAPAAKRCWQCLVLLYVFTAVFIGCVLLSLYY